jgi:hypothetical protein
MKDKDTKEILEMFIDLYKKVISFEIFFIISLQIKLIFFLKEPKYAAICR